MGRKKKGTFDRIPRIIFYVLVVFVTVGFLLAEAVYPSEQSKESRKQNLIYQGSFVWEKEDGSQEKIEIPGKYDVPAGETMELVTVLPQEYNGSAFAVRSSMQTVRFYVGGELREEYDTTHTRPFGKDSASRYVFCPVTAQDAGKELHIMLMSNADRYSGVVNEIYAGEKADIWAYILNIYGLECGIALFMFFAGILTVLFGIALGVAYKMQFDIEYLGWCILMGAVWMIGESKLRQLWIPNASILMNLCFVVIIMCPIPILLYVDSVQEGRYRKLYRVWEGLAFFNLVVLTLLQKFEVADYLDTVPVSYGLLICVFIMVILTFIWDMFHGKSHDYHLALAGVAIAMASAVIEMVSTYFVTTISGIFLGAGLIILLFLNIIRTVMRVRELEKRRHKDFIEQRRRQTEKVWLEAIKALSATVEAKDDYVRGHSKRVAEYSALIAKELGWSPSRIANLKNAAYMHDVGMVSIPDSIVNKPTKLSEEETELIRSHTKVGLDILKDITLIDHVGEIAKHHHERYDGTGYPDALVGEDISIGARIVAVADSYDAMSSKRIYRNAMTKEEIIREFETNRGTQFDPNLVDIFVRLLKEDRVVLPQEEKTGKEDFESETSKFISDVMSTMVSHENSDSFDFLTGLPMRNKGEKMIAQLMQEHDGCLVFIDMDNLKRINDVYGHKAGDRALRILGNVLSDSFENAVICRFGGDEFLAFLSDCTKEQVTEYVERVFSRFEMEKEADVELRQANLSAGLSMTTRGESFELCYTNADKALYYVKQNGKGTYFFSQQMENHEKLGAGRDLALVAKALRESGSYTGALDLDYRAFAKIYEYVNSLGERYKHSCYLIMVTMETLPDHVMYIENIEQALECMERAIRERIRKVDVCTRFSSMQYLIILFELKEDQIAGVMDRAFSEYYKLYNKFDFVPRYEFIPMMDQEEAGLDK